MTEESVQEKKQRIIAAGYKAVDELIKVAEEAIISNNNDTEDLAADKLKNAAATKKLAIFDAFEILSRLEAENEMLSQYNNGSSKADIKQGFAERRSK